MVRQDTIPAAAAFSYPAAASSSSQAAAAAVYYVCALCLRENQLNLFKLIFLISNKNNNFKKLLRLEHLNYSIQKKKWMRSC